MSPKEEIEKYKNKFVKLDSHLAKKFVDIVELKNDVKRIEYYSKHYSEKYKIQHLTKHYETFGTKELTKDEAISSHCIAMSIILLYYMCFDKKSRAKTFTLNERIFKGYPGLKERHRENIDLRNKYVAHDDNFFGLKVKMEVGIDEKNVIITLPSHEFGKITSFPNVEFEELEPLLSIMKSFLTNLEKETKELIAKRDLEILARNLKRFYARVDLNIPITQNNLDDWSKNKN